MVKVGKVHVLTESGGKFNVRTGASTSGDSWHRSHIRGATVEEIEAALRKQRARKLCESIAVRVDGLRVSGCSDLERLEQVLTLLTELERMEGRA